MEIAHPVSDIDQAMVSSPVPRVTLLAKGRDIVTDNNPILEVYSTGSTTVVGFGGRDVFDDANVAVYREELVKLIEEVGCETLAFDLTGVKFLPSGLLGLLTTLRNHNVQVHIYNPSPDVREALSITHLDTLMTVHDINVAPPPS